MASDVDALFEEDGVLAEVETVAIKRVIAYQIEQEMQAQNITKTKMAQMMDTSRASVDRLLSPTHASLTLRTLGVCFFGIGQEVAYFYWVGLRLYPTFSLVSTCTILSYLEIRNKEKNR